MAQYEMCNILAQRMVLSKHFPYLSAKNAECNGDGAFRYTAGAPARRRLSSGTISTISMAAKMIAQPR